MLEVENLTTCFTEDAALANGSLPKCASYDALELELELPINSNHQSFKFWVQIVLLEDA